MTLPGSHEWRKQSRDLSSGTVRLSASHHIALRGVWKWQSLLREPPSSRNWPHLGGHYFSKPARSWHLRALVIPGWTEHCLETVQAIAWGIGRSTAWWPHPNPRCLPFPLWMLWSMPHQPTLKMNVALPWKPLTFTLHL